MHFVRLATTLLQVDTIHIFSARCYASAVLAMALCPSVCLSVRLSVTSRSSTKTAKRRITQTTPHVRGSAYRLGTLGPMSDCIETTPTTAHSYF